ncbi:Hydroxysqualene dehydroxylase [Azospirillaceae bacterium]
MTTVHIIGAGLAGLACAARLLQATTSHTLRIEIHEAARHPGGRCRTFYDTHLSRRIDNGNHLLLSANQAVLSYLHAVSETPFPRAGIPNTFFTPSETVFPFYDHATGEHWSIHPNQGIAPWWLFCPSRRIPKTSVRDYLSPNALRLLTAGADACVADCIPKADPLHRRFWEPLCLAVMNAPPTIAAAAPLRAVLLKTFGRGATYCKPLIARDGLSDALIDPAVAFLKRRGTEIRFGHRARALRFTQKRVERLEFAGESESSVIELGENDCVVLATPPAVTANLAPNISAPQESSAIINAHFRLDSSPTLPELRAPFLGLINTTAHWLFVRDDVVSLTISGADNLLETPENALIAQLWKEAATALSLPANGSPPPHRIIKEKRATFAQTPSNFRLRPAPTTAWRNLFLAGDWTDTGLPATMESAVLSGQRAATLVNRFRLKI